MPVASMLELLEAGVHFGHQTQRWNPKMKKYIYGERNGIYIIEQEATRCNSFYISRRWLGGTLTNFETIRTRIKKLNELEELRDSGHFDRLPKKEVAVMTRQIAKLNKSLGGVKKMRGMPDLLFIIDQKRELIAIKEANKLNIPIIGLVDTNCDPEDINYVIPGNDDAIRAIKLIAGKIADAVLEGKALRESAGVSQEETAEKIEEVKPEDAGVTEEDLKLKVEGLEEVIEKIEEEK